MIKNLQLILLTGTLLMVSVFGYSQGLPPGWEFSATPSTYIVSVPVESTPNINDFALNPGDWIGAFYLDDEGLLACGGAAEWLGDANTGIIAFGDDSFSTEKDGFASGEAITYKFYSWSVNKEYEVEVICDNTLPVACDVFVSSGLAGIESCWANGYYIAIQVDADSLCLGDEAQLLVEPSGAPGPFTYSWYSDPEGFSSSIQNPLVSPTDSTYYGVVVSNSTESLEARIYIKVFPAPLADAGEDITSCDDAIVSLNGVMDNGQSFIWSSDGDGNFNSVNVLDPQYTPGPEDISFGSVQITLSVLPIQPCVINAVSNVQLSITELPLVVCGTDLTVCEDELIFTDASVANTADLLWASSGDGTFNDATQLETQYFPGSEDIQNSTVVLSLTALAIFPCTGTATDSYNIHFTYLPFVNAGTDQLSCDNNEIELSGEINNYSNLLWSSTGDGTFEDTSDIETIYYPGIQDVANGAAELLLTALPISPCTGSFEDAMMLTINLDPIVFAGDDALFCGTESVQLNGTVNYSDDVTWSTDGDGTFDDANSLNPLYFPGTNDVVNGLFELTLLAQPIFPCLLDVQDDLSVTIQEPPTANAGEDGTVALNDTYLLQGVAENYYMLAWSTSGDGSFDEFDILDPIYTPGSFDIQNAGALLSLTAFPLSPCTVNAMDVMELSIDTIVGFKEKFSLKLHSVYPNPSHGDVYITFNESSHGELNIQLFDEHANRVLEKDVNTPDAIPVKNIKLDLSEFKAGVYILKINQNGVSYHHKILLIE